MFQIDLDGLSSNCCICSVVLLLLQRTGAENTCIQIHWDGVNRCFELPPFLSFLNGARCRFTGSFFYWDDRYGQSKNWGMLSLNSCLCIIPKTSTSYSESPQKAEQLASQSEFPLWKAIQNLGAVICPAKSICKKCDMHTLAVCNFYSLITAKSREFKV